MSDWLSYSPEDFLLFSPRVFYRLIELHNEALWPAQFAAVVLGLVLLILLVRGGQQAELWLGTILGVAWLWVAWSFLWERFATINWAMTYVAPMFAAQGALLLWSGATRRLSLAQARWQRAMAALLLTFAVIIYPFLAPLEGRSFAGSEVFGLFPDPTAIAALAVLAAMRKGLALMVIPLLWCALSSETLSLLQSPGYFVPAASAAIAVMLHVAGRVSASPART